MNLVGISFMSTIVLSFPCEKYPVSCMFDKTLLKVAVAPFTANSLTKCSVFMILESM